MVPASAKHPSLTLPSERGGNQTNSRFPLRELVAQEGNGLVVGHAVGTALFEGAELLGVEEGAVGAEFSGGGAVDEVARVVGAHLEQDAEHELAHCLAVEGAGGAGGGVDPDEDVDAERGAFLDDLGELGGG